MRACSAGPFGNGELIPHHQFRWFYSSDLSLLSAGIFSAAQKVSAVDFTVSKSASKTGTTFELFDAPLELVSSGASARVILTAYELTY
jgi:hypothetical protein